MQLPTAVKSRMSLSLLMFDLAEKCYDKASPIHLTAFDPELVPHS